jgi:hypothetical protein
MLDRKFSIAPMMDRGVQHHRWEYIHVPQGAADQNLRRPQLSPISLHDHGFAAPFETRSPGQQACWSGAPATFGAAPPHGRTIRTKMRKKTPSRRIDGVTPPPSRLKFIRRCGVSRSLRGARSFKHRIAPTASSARWSAPLRSCRRGYPRIAACSGSARPYPAACRGPLRPSAHQRRRGARRQRWRLP